MTGFDNQLQPDETPSARVESFWVVILKDILLETLLPAIGLAILINLFVAQSTYVFGQSMEPNLHTNQRLMIEKVSYRFHTPQRGDIVVVDVPVSDIPLIKRVIGLSGETIEMRDSRLFVDGVVQPEEYLTVTRQRNFGPVSVPADAVFVMGDNRNASNDSRAFGPVPLTDILGRAWVSYWPRQDIYLMGHSPILH